MSAYIALGVMMIAAIHAFFYRHHADLKNWVYILVRGLRLLVMPVLLVPSSFSVYSQVRSLDQIKMLIANQGVW